MTKRPVAAMLFAVGAASLAGCAPAPETTAGASRAPAAVAAGEPVRCLQTSSIDTSRVHDDRTIDFVMRNGTVYRNTLPVSCSPLGFEKRFAYRTNTSQLCNSDTITVLQSGGVNGPTCGLGEFVPVRLTD